VGIVVGADVGGTFTDLVLYDEEQGACSIAKVLSTPQDQSIGLLNGLKSLDVPVPRLSAIVHGTTVATNALLERKGARLALVTTLGFRDIAELHTRERPSLYGLRGQFMPLIPRDRRFEVAERTDAQGRILVPLDRDALRVVSRKIRELAVEGVVVVFLNSFANPTNEREAGALLEEFFPGDSIVLSNKVLPAIGEYERTSTAIIDAYVQPLVGRYLQSLERRLASHGYQRNVLVVQSNGGIVGSPIAARSAVNTILSGPAAGVIAGSYIASTAGFERCITCDMGGTSFDVCLVDGKPTMANRKQVDYGLNVGLSMIDINAIGAGGGSVAHLDNRGFLAVGPRSTGANPGPACYGRGGAEPTVTDANLVLGRLNPKLKPGTDAELSLDIDRARAAVGELGKTLGLDAVGAADAIIAVANRNMSASIRLVSIERGYDPRDFVLVVFGGAGPLHATALMRELGSTRALIPFYPGLGCALGCVMADLKHEFTEYLDRRVADLDPAELDRITARHVAAGKDLLENDHAGTEQTVLVREADMAYEGQLNTVRVHFPSAARTREDLVAAFREQYRKLYRRLLDPLPVRMVNLRTSIIGIRPKIALRDLRQPGAESEGGPAEQREVNFSGRFVRTPVYRRNALSEGAVLKGPAIVESDDTTVVIDPGITATVDHWWNLLLEDRR
jgi:N-methylhydantoinase A